MKKIFGSNGDVDKNAYLNWRTKRHRHFHNFKIISDGHLLSSLLAVEKCLEDNWDKKADILAFPILFNLNQAIEGYLKVLVWELNILLKTGRGLPTGHNIQQLYNEFHARLREYETKSENFSILLSELKPVKEYIDELYSLINPRGVANKNANMDFSRYPLDKDLKNHFYIESFDNVTFDIEAMQELIMNVKDVLPRLVDYYEEIIDESFEEQ